jgi:hypothetical protein
VRRMLIVVFLGMAVLYGPAAAVGQNGRTAEIAGRVSEERVAEVLKGLESFTTRNLFSSNKPHSGIKAAGDWIFKRFKEANPDLEVSFDSYVLPKQGRRLARDVELRNVLAVLPGQGCGADRIFILNAHYDTISRSADGRFHSDDVDTPAPGTNDDASGVAALIEIARVFAGQSPDATVCFAAFAGEEMGLIGSTLLAQKLKAEGKNVTGVFTLDMIGNVTSGNGESDSEGVRVFSAGPADSPSRQLARYAKTYGELYFPSAPINLILRADRFGRGGDHTPFVLEGFAGIRFMEANENFGRQHTPEDTFENMSLSYCTRNIRIVASVLHSLASSPPAPKVTNERGRPRLGRGPSGYDAALGWEPIKCEDLAGYRVHWRRTTSSCWEHHRDVGPVNEYVIPDVSIDEFVFGVSAVDKDGYESLVAPYTMAPRSRQTFQTKKE